MLKQPLVVCPLYIGDIPCLIKLTDFVLSFLDFIITAIFIQNVKARYSNGTYFPDSKDITEVPADIPDEAKKVDLSSCRISRLRANAFVNLPKCTYLSLEGNTISHIETGAFNGLKNLEKLVLRRNQLKLLDSGVFSELESLKELDLNNNKFATFNSTILEGW